MTDREMLELAAKAAGYSFSWNEQFDCAEIWRATDKKKTLWQPHRDDGDALRLAVTLGVDVSISGNATIACGDVLHVRESGLDVYAATRRAIVRAAAEIGRAMG